MKKLYNNKSSGRVHPSPPPLLNSGDQFSILPAAIMTLAAALSPQDKEVLAYLISCSSSSPNSFSSCKSSTGRSGSGGDHPAQFHCDCFRCYMSYWVRWDASPNRHLIHEIIEAHEDGVFSNQKQAGGHVRSKKERRKKVADLPAAKDDRGSGEREPVGLIMDSHHDLVDEEKVNEDGELCNSDQSGVSTLRKLVGFIGERIWGVWGII